MLSQANSEYLVKRVLYGLCPLLMHRKEFWKCVKAPEI